MRAAVLRAGELTVRETADPEPGPGQLLLRTLSCAVCASDVHFMDHGADDAGDGLFGGYDAQADVVMGHEFVGEVVGRGADVDERDFPPGSRVTSVPFLMTADGGRIVGQHTDAPGGFGELMLVSRDLARVLPETVADDTAALVDAFAVGEGYVRQSGITGGEVPVVLGAGAIGLSAVAALDRRGIAPIVVSDFNPQRRQLAKTFGADVTVDPAAESPYDAWHRESPAGSRCFVYECVGAPGIVRTIASECPNGSLISCAGGHYTDDKLDIATATRNGLKFHFGGVPELDDWYGTLDAVLAGRLDPSPAIGSIIGLDGVADALDAVRNAHGPPRIVVKPNGTEAR